MPYKDIEKRREVSRKWGKKQKEMGLCHTCKRSVMQGYTKCIYHYYKQKEYDKSPERKEARMLSHKKTIDKMIIENKCQRCGVPLIEGENIVCIACRIKRNESDAKARRINYATAN